jgi:hypothetical protein
LGKSGAVTKFFFVLGESPPHNSSEVLARLNFFLFFLFLRFASKEAICQRSAVCTRIWVVMALKRAATQTSLIDVLDRVLDKGIVIDAWVRVSLVGLDLLQVEARIVVASINTYLTHAHSLESNTIASLLPMDQSSLRIHRRRNRVTLPITTGCVS